MSFAAPSSTLVRPRLAPFWQRGQQPNADAPSGEIRRLLCLPWHLLQEARPPIVAIFAVRMVVSIGLVPRCSWTKLVVLAGWLGLTIAAYAFNGLCDLQGDRANGSRRPLATGRLDPRAAAASILVLACASELVCWRVSRFDGLIGLASLAIGWAYSAGPGLKRHALACCGSVGAAAALTYLVGAHEAGSGGRITWTLAIWSCWIAAASAAKDFSDVTGDTIEGRRTLAVLHGPRSAARLVAAAVTLISAGLLSATLTCERSARWIGLASVPASLALITALLQVRDEHDTRLLRRPYRVFMAAQFTVNAAVLVCMA